MNQPASDSGLSGEKNDAGKDIEIKVDLEKDATTMSRALGI